MELHVAGVSARQPSSKREKGAPQAAAVGSRHPFVDAYKETVPVMLSSIEPERRSVYPIIKGKSISQCCDAVPNISEHEANTDSIAMTTSSIMHNEGGWPKEINAADHQETTKWRRRTEKDPGFVVALKKLVAASSEIFHQNDGLNFYESYFEGENLRIATELPSAKIISVCKGRCNGGDATNLAVTSLSWNPESASKFAAAYTNYSDINKAKSISEVPSSATYIWDSEMPNEPLVDLESTGPVLSLQYNQKKSDLLVGGTVGGIVELWDVRVGRKPTATSPLEYSHMSPIVATNWVQSKANHEIVSVSSNGFALWWDLRNFSKPIDSFEFVDTSNTDGTLINLGGKCLEGALDATYGKYLVGTLQGTVLALTKNYNEGVEVAQRYHTVGNYGPIHAVKRNIAYPQYFFTISDWSIKLWNEELKHPIFSTDYDKVPVLCGQWSPTRSGLCMVGQQDGNLDFWEFYESPTNSTYSYQVSDTALTSLTVHRKGKYVAVGDEGGTVSILELNESLFGEDSAEKAALEKVLQADTRREKKREAAKKQAILAEDANGKLAANMELMNEAPEILSRDLEADFFATVGLHTTS